MKTSEIIREALTHLLAVLVGAGGAYLGTASTDWRQRRRERAAAHQAFREARKYLPDLLREMKQDVMGEDNELIRELVVKPTPGTVFRPSHKRFEYDEKSHPDLRLKLDFLHDRGFLTLVSAGGDCPIYRMSDDLVARLRRMRVAGKGRGTARA